MPVENQPRPQAQILTGGGALPACPGMFPPAVDILYSSWWVMVDLYFTVERFEMAPGRFRFGPGSSNYVLERASLAMSL